MVSFAPQSCFVGNDYGGCDYVCGGQLSTGFQLAGAGATDGPERATRTECQCHGIAYVETIVAIGEAERTLAEGGSTASATCAVDRSTTFDPIDSQLTSSDAVHEENSVAAVFASANLISHTRV